MPTALTDHKSTAAERSDRYGVYLVWILLCLLLNAGASFAEPLSAQRPSVTVTGEGQVSRAPDMASLRLGVITEATAAAAALAQNSQQMRALLQTLAGLDIAVKDMQTRGVTVAPQYRRLPDGAGMQLTGYRAQHSVVVRVRDLDRLGNVLDQAVAHGANSVDGIDLGLSDTQSALDEARRAAMADARRRAALLAAEADRSLGRVLSIEESTAGLPGPMHSFAMERAGGVPIAPGELDFSSRVVVRYALD